MVPSLAAIVIAVFGMRYADQDMPGHLDRSLDTLIRNHLYRQELITRTLVSLGNPAETVILVAAVAGVAAIARRWSGVLLTIVGTIAAVMITELILKPLIGRLRYGALSFPSRHTTAVAAVAVATAILIGGARGQAVSRCAWSPASLRSQWRSASRSHWLPCTFITPPIPPPATA